MTTILSKRSAAQTGRRQFLAAMGLGGLYYTTRGAFAQTLVQTPAQTLGPYYPDRLPLDQDNDLLLINDALTRRLEKSRGSRAGFSTRAAAVRGALVEICRRTTMAPTSTRESHCDRDAEFKAMGNSKLHRRAVSFAR
jgi:protocatechuate 3,4-dioxygenase beta subunit